MMDIFPEQTTEFKNSIGKSLEGVLAHQSEPAVKSFLDELSPQVAHMIRIEPSAPLTKSVLKQKSEALEAVLKVKTFLEDGQIQIPESAREGLDTGLNYAEGYLKWQEHHYESLKTGGKPSDITYLELLILLTLRAIFVKHFPHLTGSYNQDSVLYELGITILGRNSLPSTINEMLNKVTTPFK